MQLSNTPFFDTMVETGDGGDTDIWILPPVYEMVGDPATTSHRSVGTPTEPSSKNGYVA